MRIIIVGSGLLGITTAHALWSRGHEIIVVERRKGPAQEASYANGALLTASMAEPWNAPGSWRVLLSSLGRADSPMQLRLRALPSLARWGVSFLRHSNERSFHRNTQSNLRLALYSLRMLDALRAATQIEYGRAARGSLRIFRNRAGFEKALAGAQRLVHAGLRYTKLSADETVALEPALASIHSQLVGGIHYEVDETGDAYLFCVRLEEYLRDRKVEFRYQNNACSWETQSGRIVALRAGQNRLVADRYVVAAGSYSPLLLRDIGINLPVRPVKGYSITVDTGRKDRLLQVPVVDDQLHAVVTGLEGAVRVAGTAEFCGYDLSLSPARIQNLHSLLRQVLPGEHFDVRKTTPWCGLRPVSADGVPIIGTTSVPNLFVNVGHGHLGWTMAAGSAAMLADLICGETPAIEPTPYSFGRFSAAGRDLLTHRETSDADP